jgi:hypothetical protein
MKKRKECVSTKTVVGIGMLALILLSVAGAILFLPSNDTDTSQWFKTNFFPADEYGFTSLMDADEPASEEYQGSTSSAWISTSLLSGCILLICFTFFARERGFF